jgi:predicted transcriptional regulator
MKEPAVDPRDLAEQVQISIHLDSELVEQLQHLTNDPSKIIEVAIRQWLKGGNQRDDELTRTMQRTPVPPRGEWND